LDELRVILEATIDPEDVDATGEAEIAAAMAGASGPGRQRHLRAHADQLTRWGLKAATSEAQPPQAQ
jgi:hypothetical protein